MKKLLKEYFDLDCKIEEIKAPPGLPFYALDNRCFYKASYFDVSFIIVEIKKEESFGSISLEKQLLMIEERTNNPVAFYFPHLTRAMRHSLIKKRISFISKDGEIFLPFLGLLLHRKIKDDSKKRIRRMMPLTQLLFLYLIYYLKDQMLLKKDIATALKCSKTSITRASKELISLGLIKEEKHGKDVYISLIGDITSAIDRAKPYMIDPIQRVIITERNTLSSALYSGESALAKKTMLSPPQVPYYAIDKNKIKNKNLIELDERWNEEQDLMRLELWKYDPSLLSSCDSVDPISLSITMKNNRDERIEEAIEEYKEKYQW